MQVNKNHLILGVVAGILLATAVITGGFIPKPTFYAPGVSKVFATLGLVVIGGFTVYEIVNPIIKKEDPSNTAKDMIEFIVGVFLGLVITGLVVVVIV